jgi:hypothetical protein
MGGKVATGDTSNLPGGRDLSTTFLQIGENNFSFFSCHARKPYSHKGFRRLQAGKLSGKIFPLGHQFRRSAAGKQREGTPGGTYQEINPSGKPKGKGPGKEWKGQGKGRNGKERTERHGNPLPSPVNILNNPLVASLSAFLSSAIHLGEPFKVLSRFAKNSIITAV